VYSEQTEDGGFRLYADNNHIIAVFVHVRLSRLANLRSDVDLPFGTVVQPGTVRELLFELTPISAHGRRGFGLEYSYARGDPRHVRHDDDHRYLFPFEHGTKHRVTQGYSGRFTHFGENQYGIDFDLDTGTAIKAARGGRVVEVKQDSTVGGPDPRFTGMANYVLVEHDDGSFGNYAHLKPNGAEVDVGQHIAAGDLIGYSGNTGRSSGPHLHFDVRIPMDDGRMHSIPTRFLGLNGEAITAKEHEFYYAYHPGGPPFRAVFGRDLTDEMFSDYIRAVDQTGSLQFRTEDVDLTFVAFLANGYDRAVEAEVTLTLRGVSSTIAMPRTIRIPARTEVFLTILRANPGAERIQYTPRVRYRLLDQ
jgi:murein DD-endopeptidase MepM/ murein hydrolase activator NlpD